MVYSNLFLAQRLSQSKGASDCRLAPRCWLWHVRSELWTTSESVVISDRLEVTVIQEPTSDSASIGRVNSASQFARLIARESGPRPSSTLHGVATLACS